MGLARQSEFSNAARWIVSAIECGQCLLQAEAVGPLAHQFETLLKLVGPCIGLLDHTADPIPETKFSSFADLPLVLTPRAERAAAVTCSRVFSLCDISGILPVEVLAQNVCSASAIHLPHSGVDLNTVRAWLGTPVSIRRQTIYAETDFKPRPERSPAATCRSRRDFRNRLAPR